MASGGVLWISVRPSLEGFGADLRRQIEESVPPEIRVRIRPDDPSEQGNQAAGAFADAFRSRLAASLRALPKIEINADSSDADRALAAIRTRMEELRNKRIDVDISAADAMAQLGALQAELEHLGGQSTDIRVRADTAAAAAEIERLRGQLGDLGDGGDRAGDRFARSFAERLRAGLANLPKVEIDADSTPADRALAEIRTQMEALNGKTIGVDISAAEAKAELDRLKASLDEMARKSPDVRVRVDAGAAAAELAALRAELDKLDGRKADVKVDTSSATSGMGALLTAGLALGPALIPIGAAVTAGLASIGPAALVGAGAIGALGLAFSGVGAAIGLADKAQTSAGANAAKSANQQANAASQIAAAQDGIISAERSLAQARAQAADSAISAEEKVQNAVQAEAAARVNSASSIRSALQTQASAEQTLADAQLAGQRAQENLTQARKDAAAALLSLTFQTQDNALAQRSAVIQLAQAKAAQEAFARTGGTSLQNDQVNLGVDEAQQRLVELRSQGSDLASQKADADKKGIEGSQQVRAAQDAITAAVRRTQDAELSLQNANLAVVKAQTDGAASIAKAEQSLADARRAQTLQQMTSEDSIASAKQGVVSAERALESAQRSAAQSTAGASSATNAYAEALKKLSPAAREFVEFYVSTLKPQLDDLKAAAAAGLFPGLEAGLRNASPVFGQLKTFVSNISTAMGDLARDAGAALTKPFWHDFFDFMSRIAGPTIKDLGKSFGNFAQGLAGIFQALYQPVFVPIMQWFKDFSERVRNFGTSAAAGTNGSFNSFIEYVKENGPKVRELIGAVLGVVSKLIEGLSGQGASTLTLLTDLLKWMASLPPGVLAALYDVFVAYRLMKLADGLLLGLDKVLITLGLSPTGGIRGALSAIGGFGGLAALLGVGAAVAGLQLLSGKLDELNVKWQQGPDGKPTTQAQKTVGQSATNNAVTALHSAANGDELGQVAGAVGKGDFGSHETFDLKNSTVGKLFKGIGDQWNKDLANIGTSPAGKLWATVSKWWADVKPNISKWWTDNVATPTRNFFTGLPAAISKWWTDNVETPTRTWFTSLGIGISKWWTEHVWNPTRDFFTGLPATITKWWTDNVWVPTRNFFTGLPGTIRKWWEDNVSKPTSEFFTGLGNSVVTWWHDRIETPLVTAVNTAGDKLGQAWRKVANFFRDPINWVIRTVIDDGILNGWNTVMGWIGQPALKATPLAELPMFAAGGKVTGPGSGTSDSILARVSDGEYIVPASTTSRHLNFLEALRKGQPEAVQAAGGSGNPNPYPHFAAGGIVNAQNIAQAMNGKPYIWGGVGPEGADCCIIGGVRVYGDFGAKPMSEVQSGDMVFSHVDGKLTLNQVTAAWKSKTQPVFKVRTRNRSVTASANHPFLRLVKTDQQVVHREDADWAGLPAKGARRGGGCTVSTCTSPDWARGLCVMHGRRYGAQGDPRLWSTRSEVYEPQWARLDELRRGDLLVQPKAMVTESVIDPTLSDGTPISEDVAWLVGALLGDGTVYDRRVALCLFGEDRDRAAEIIRTTWGGTPGYSASSGVRISHAVMARALLDLGLAHRGSDKRVPGAVWTWPQAQQRAFLDGYCDADGHRPKNATKHGERTYHSAARELIEDVRALHIMLGDPISNVTVTKRTKPITIKGKLVGKALDQHSVAVWPGVGRGETVLRQNAGIRDWLDSAPEFTLARVLGVSDEGVQDTYDLTVDDAHNFVADGVVVHNSGYQSIITNALRGVANPYVRLGTAETFPWAGFQSGLGGAYSVGAFKGNPGHMSGTLAGVNVESGGPHNNVAYGGPAVGADASEFNIKAFLPEAGGVFASGGAGGAAQSVSWWSLLADKVKSLFSSFLNFGGMPAQESLVGDAIKRIPTGMVDQTVSALEKKLTNLFSIITQTVGGAASPVGMDIQAAVDGAAKPFGWGIGSPNWTPLSLLIGRESSWNPNAQNPSSTAYGLFQFLDSTWGTVGGAKTSNPGLQAAYGMQYIKNRYGDPRAAWGHETSAGWFDQGGMLMPGITAAINATGNPERILTPEQTASYDQMMAFARDHSTNIALAARTSAGSAKGLIQAAADATDRTRAPAGDTFHITARDEHSEARIAAEVQRRREFARRTR